ncbi:hypothetical protein [Marinifilum caeruleilacunae]|uniref:Anti-sigma factor n=1 Tax=Marinifilum caeruleilacunae TaxID=2499076 RepID=A0ABX1X1B9_9BACT|nr:hypothetical protein [Marinifilum caeruleilacunae]NOU62204.1 hypothetical protein [Marinifilum caeruleilacunae]
MKELEKVFREHREVFDDQDPGNDHFENFLGKLNDQQKTKPLFGMSNFLKVAAIIIFVVISVVTGYQIRKMQTPEHLGLGAVSPEYQEVELFYTSNIDSQLRMIERMGSFDNTDHQNILAEELKEMDKRYNQLKEELKLHPDDDRVIQAMIEYYQVKTNILNRIIEQLYQVRKQTKNNLNVSA